MHHSESDDQQESETYEVTAHEETKQSIEGSERKQLFKTPSEKNVGITHGYVPGQDTHEKINNLFEKESDAD